MIHLLLLFRCIQARMEMANLTTRACEMNPKPSLTRVSVRLCTFSRFFPREWSGRIHTFF